MKPYVIPVLAATAVALGACRNGPNNARDTTGMPNNSAAGSISPGSGLGPGATTGVAAPGAAMPGAATPGAAGAVTPMDTTRDTMKHKKKY